MNVAGLKKILVLMFCINFQVFSETPYHVSEITHPKSPGQKILITVTKEAILDTEETLYYKFELLTPEGRKPIGTEEKYSKAELLQIKTNMKSFALSSFVTDGILGLIIYSAISYKYKVSKLETDLGGDNGVIDTPDEVAAFNSAKQNLDKKSSYKKLTGYFGACGKVLSQIISYGTPIGLGIGSLTETGKNVIRYLNPFYFLNKAEVVEMLMNGRNERLVEATIPMVKFVHPQFSDMNEFVECLENLLQ
jgi:hypothetical protein